MAVTFNIGHMSTAPLMQQYPSYFRSIASHAINDVAFQARRDLGTHASKVFKSPRNLTRNPAEVLKPKSTPETLQVRIGLRDQVAKGTAPDVYLRPQIYGGPRNHKRFEKALLNRIPEFGYHTFFVPASQNKEFLDPAGMVKGSVIVQMLSHLQAFGEQGYKANIKNPNRALYFAVPYRSKEFGMLHPGIYKRDSIGSDFFKAVVYAIKTQPRYKKRFFYFERVEKSAKQVFPMSFARRFQRIGRQKAKTFNLTGQRLQTRLQRQVKMGFAIMSNRRVQAIRQSYGITRTGNTPILSRPR